MSARTMTACETAVQVVRRIRWRTTLANGLPMCLRCSAVRRAAAGVVGERAAAAVAAAAAAPQSLPLRRGRTKSTATGGVIPPGPGRANRLQPVTKVTVSRSAASGAARATARPIAHADEARGEERKCDIANGTSPMRMPMLAPRDRMAAGGCRDGAERQRCTTIAAAPEGDGAGVAVAATAAVAAAAAPSARAPSNRLERQQRLHRLHRHY